MKKKICAVIALIIVLSNAICLPCEASEETGEEPNLIEPFENGMDFYLIGDYDDFLLTDDNYSYSIMHKK